MKTSNMNAAEFNAKWKDYLEPRFYGLAIDNQEVINFLDKEFEKETSINPNFRYSQIKKKFNSVKVYTNTEHNSHWAKEISKILNP